MDTKILKKVYRINPQIGATKHSVSFHNGEKTHKDGSPFFDLKTFKNKRLLTTFIKGLKPQGYTEHVN
jgi:hypothetical protein